MVGYKEIQNQLARIKYSTKSWNRAETYELANIILPDEIIYECVNGWYDGGFALLVSTDIRVLLIDKKPFKYLAIEDVRFDTITQIDYGHRFLDAHIGISTGMKDLKFRSYNKERLRKLISHVQNRMAEIKAEQNDHSYTQQEHLQQIDNRLNQYLISQQTQQELISKQLDQVQTSKFVDPDLKDSTLFDDNLSSPKQLDGNNYDSSILINGVSSAELYQAGKDEIFHRRIDLNTNDDQIMVKGILLNTLMVAYSKLPAILKNRFNSQELTQTIH
jgi:hypothetical protein